MTDVAPTGKRVKVYDFKRPDKFSKDQIRTVAIMHEVFARQTTTVLSSQLMSLAHVHVELVDQCTYEEFIRNAPNPCTLAVVTMEPLKGSAVLAIEPAIAFAIIGRLFGGPGDEPPLSRELTDIEASVMEQLIVRLLGNLRDAWATIIDLRPRLGQIETNPQFVQIVPPAEMVVLVALEARIGTIKGMMYLCLPYLTIEPIVPKLSALFIYSSVHRGPGAVGRDPLSDHIAGFPIPSEVFRAGPRCSLRELGSLRKGSKIPLPLGFHDHAVLRMGGRIVLDLVRQARGYAVAPAARKPIEFGAAGTVHVREGSDTDSGLRKSLEELAARIGQGLEAVTRGIADLQQKQAAMAAELSFAQADQGGSPTPPLKPGPFDFVRRADASHFLVFLQGEHPQLIAMVLSYLDPNQASVVLGRLTPDLQPEVARRIATIGRVAPEVLGEVARVLERKLAIMSSEEPRKAGGVDSLVEILSMSDRSTEQRVIESLERRDASLAEVVKRSMFVFEDILLLDQDAAARVLQRVDVEDMLRAMKAAPPEVQQFLWAQVPAADAKALRARYDTMGRLRLSEVQKAQSRIVALIRELAENGEIVIPRAGQTVE